MRTRLVAIAGLVALAFGLLVPLAWAEDVFVNGHVRRDGTYVQPHWRSAPDSSVNNNWSTSPNINPHTGQQGTRQPRLFDSNESLSGSGGSRGGFGWGGAPPRSRSRW